jgi:DNA-directed RNA polymerase specialized sigma24 family protein
MNNERVLTQEYFDAMLAWLDPNRDQAGQKYERIRQRLIRIFICRGCNEAEDLADETINRVALKSPQFRENFVGEPIKYFCGVANKVHLEYLRRKLPTAPPPEPDKDADDEMEVEHNCLDNCMEQLSAEKRDLFYKYFEEEKAAKIAQRKRLAKQFGVSLNALRIRAHRIRATLESCVKACVSQLETGSTAQEPASN